MATDKQPKVFDLCRMTEDEARAYLEAIRWPNGPVCPHCGGCERVMELKGKSTRPGLRKCGDCRKPFTVTVGTIFERSHIALSHWVYAIATMCASKKGVSAHQLHRELGITYKAAWFMCHRIRHAFTDDGTAPNLMGTVEIDEMYVGPRRPRIKGSSKKGRGTSKQPVIALVERGGRARMRVIPDVKGTTLKAMIRAHVQKSATLMTDEWPGYYRAGAGYAGHMTINHGQGEYARPDGASTNTAESYFALFRRGLIGTFHHVSVQHLQRYCDEFAFRWDHRKAPDVDRTAAAIGKVGGKRLFYREPRA